ncbi:MAG: acyl--CoA ligase [Actinobacteria bacterium]|nr:acyl--CoA ligase [Actinomycetota bacterium]
MTLADLLFAPRYGYESDEALVYAGDEEMTYAELVERAGNVRDGLRDGGFVRGQSVAVMLPNDADTIATIFGVWAAGGVYVPLNPRMTDDEVTRVLSMIPVALVITTDEERSRLGTIAASLDQPYEGFRVDVTARAQSEDVALVQMTSGTTGPPKPVLLTHSSVLALLDGVLGKVRGQGTRKRSSTPNLIPVSLSLWAGIYNVCFAFRVGAPVVLMNRFEPVEFAALVADYGVKSVVLPPAALAMLCDSAEIDTLAPLEWVRSITAPLSPFLARRFHEKFGIGVLNSYGQTELGGEIVGWNAADWRAWGTKKLGSVGRPHAGVEVRAVDGELQVRTSDAHPGYADPEMTLDDRLTADGWFRTGDLGHVDDEDFVWVEGRVSEQINRGGMKVIPSEVEEVLAGAVGVREAAIVGATDERLGEVPVAFIVPQNSKRPPSSDELEAHCREHLGPWKVPVRFETLDALPRNEVGKVLKGRLFEIARSLHTKMSDDQ